MIQLVLLVCLYTPSGEATCGVFAVSQLYETVEACREERQVWSNRVVLSLAEHGVIVRDVTAGCRAAGLDT